VGHRPAIVVVTTRGNKTGKLRKPPLMRVEHSGEYALVASQGGQPRHPVRYHNLKADPEAVTIQDGPQPFDVRVREVTGNERAAWWKRRSRPIPLRRLPRTRGAPDPRIHHD
jgi:deazaflavin-dependent oxidoreductase (nitroreductase family)